MLDTFQRGVILMPFVVKNVVYVTISLYMKKSRVVEEQKAVSDIVSADALSVSKESDDIETIYYVFTRCVKFMRVNSVINMKWSNYVKVKQCCFIKWCHFAHLFSLYSIDYFNEVLLQSPT
jgi:hypothetical protein